MAFGVFLMTDVVGSTALWEEYRDDMAAALEQHDHIVNAAIDAEGGRVFKHTGDGAFAVFESVDHAARSALRLTASLAAASWGPTGPIEVRVSVHAGDVIERGGDYFGPPLNRTARINGVGHGGQVLLSDAAHHLLNAPSGRDLGEHQLRDLSDPVRLWQLDDGDHPPLRTLQPVRHNLPEMPTEFVGRVAESAAVQRLIRQHRLVSLVGVGGCGKTRLAMEVAASSADHFPGGVWFVDLAVEQNEGEVGTRALSALGLPAATADLSSTVEALAQATADLATLVVLDNCEHVIDGAADFAAAVLDTAPQVTVLATSREALAVDGEQAWRVPNLSESAVELFVARAVASGADRTMLSDDLSVVEEICRRLDDIPLAIELAASHAGSLSLADVASHLDERFTLLDGGRRRGRTRQRQHTLKAMVDWSYDLLEPAQRRLLAELAVFAGSFSLDGVEAVATLPAPEIRATLQTLVTQSLVTPPDRDGRYRLLETIRLYALDRLTEADAVATTRDRHLAWVRACIGAESAIMTDPGDGSTTMAHELLAIAECDNGIAAMEWAEASGRHDDVFDVFTGLMPVWSNIPSRARAGLEWLDRIGEPPPSEPGRRAGWLMIAGQTRMNLGDLAGAMIDHLRGAQHIEELLDGPPNRFYTWAPVLRQRSLDHAMRGEMSAAFADADLLEEMAAQAGAHRPAMLCNASLARTFAFALVSDEREVDAALRAAAALDGVSIYAAGLRSIPASSLLRAGRLEEALAEAERCLRSSVASVWARGVALGVAAEALSLQGDAAAALDVVSADLGPALTSQRLHLADNQLIGLAAIHSALGQDDRARDLLETTAAISTDPFTSYGRPIVTALLGEGDVASLSAASEGEVGVDRVVGVIDEAIADARALLN